MIMARMITVVMICKQCKWCGRFGPHPQAHLWPIGLCIDWDGTQRGYCSSGSEPPRKAPKGVSDSDLWCTDCETASHRIDDKVIPVLKDYRKHLSFGPGIAEFTCQSKSQIQTLSGLDPLDLYLFALSIVWRASASDRHEVKSFTLGPYQDVVKKIVQSGTWPADGSRQFQTLVCLERDNELRGLVGLPVGYRFCEMNSVQFIGAGVEFKVNTDRRSWGAGVDSYTLHQGRPLYVIGHSYAQNRMGQHLKGVIEKNSNWRKKR